MCLRVPRPAAFVALVLAGALAPPLAAQEPAPATDGPVIRGYGAVWDIPGAELATPTDRDYRIVFDVSESSEEPGEVNPHLNTVARFLNMHARAGVPTERMQLAVVLHGTAAKDALRPESFRARYGVENRNAELVRRLADAGVRFLMCGQSTRARDLPEADLLEPVEMALSAMTARAVLHAEGYRTVN